jgi:hypothetical protein
MFVLVNACLCEINQHSAEMQWVAVSLQRPVECAENHDQTTQDHERARYPVPCFGQRADAGVLAAVKLSSRASLSKKIVKK